MDTRVRPGGFCLLLWALGLAGLPLAHWALIERVEPLYTPIYSFLWWSWIFVADWCVWRLRGRSMLSERPREFLLLTLWSSPLWLFFEVLNLRLQNWYYVQVPFDVFGFRLWGLMPAYMTVLPGVFETAELIETVARKYLRNGRVSDRPVRIGLPLVSILCLLGVAMIVLPMRWPRFCFCLVWGFPFLLFDPMVYLWEKRRREASEQRVSILSHLERGDATRLVALLASGCATGLLWELWNLGARTKWIYTVPGFENLKIGEMPVLGFLGFPPFVLSCYAMVNAIGFLRGGRSWMRSARENRRRRGLNVRTAARIWLGIAAFWCVATLGLLRGSVSSFSLPVDRVWRHRLSQEGVRWIRERNVRRTHEFLGLSDIPDAIDPALWLEMRAVSELAEVRGMGLLYAAALYAEGVKTPVALGRMNETAVLDVLKRRLRPERLPRRAQVRVWLRATRGR